MIRIVLLLKGLLLKINKMALYGLISLSVVSYCFFGIRNLILPKVVDSDGFDKEIYISINIRSDRPLSINDHYSFTKSRTYSYDGSMRGGFILRNLNPDMEEVSIYANVSIFHPVNLKLDGKTLDPKIHDIPDIKRIYPPGTTMESILKSAERTKYYDYDFQRDFKEYTHITYYLEDIDQKITSDLSAIRLRIGVTLQNNCDSSSVVKNIRDMNFNVPLTEEVQLFNVKDKKFDQFYAEKSMNYNNIIKDISCDKKYTADDTVFIKLQNREKKRSRDIYLLIYSTLLGIGASGLWQIIFHSWSKGKK